MIQVELFHNATSPDPIRSLYLAYRVAYSALTPSELNARIDSERITRQQMTEFITARLETGHASPLQQVVFEFGISGVSRAFSHQFVRHHVGLDVEQQSQRYVSFEGKQFPYTIPPSAEIAGEDEYLKGIMEALQNSYNLLVGQGMPPEDARFVLPNAANTNLKVTINFLEMLHMADLRLCTRAQWEFRKVMAMMRAEVVRYCPELGRSLQPKCGEGRMGFCDESYEAWQACPLGAKRPHKKDLFAFAMRHRAIEPLGQAEYSAIEEN